MGWASGLGFWVGVGRLDGSTMDSPYRKDPIGKAIREVNVLPWISHQVTRPRGPAPWIVHGFTMAVVESAAVGTTLELENRWKVYKSAIAAPDPDA